MRFLVPGAKIPFFEIWMLAPLNRWISTRAFPPGPRIAPTIFSPTSISILVTSGPSLSIDWGLLRVGPELKPVPKPKELLKRSLERDVVVGDAKPGPRPNPETPLPRLPIGLKMLDPVPIGSDIAEAASIPGTPAVDVYIP
ncbi:UNVERIFIED_CONTAM: hypothetical protein NCL1_41766 [Trichonephila clavipes]